MKGKAKLYSAVLGAGGMLILILDTKTALLGAQEGIQLCLETLIPSLFPFFIMSTLLTSSILGHNQRVFGPLEQLLRIPRGAGALVAVGMLGGYPVGAASIAQAVRAGNLSHRDGRRMLAFCSNAGPAFLFGIGARVFGNVWMCWLLWGIHIFSALMVGILTPGKAEQIIPIKNGKSVHLVGALRKSVEVMALVCGWVVLMRVALAFLERWFLRLIPKAGQVLIFGLLEIANGCCALPELGNIGLQFLLCSVFLGFGGLCVALQTLSVTEGLDGRLYLPGKITQGAISLLLAWGIQGLFPEGQQLELPLWIPGICLLICCGYFLVGRKMQKRGSFSAAAAV